MALLELTLQVLVSGAHNFAHARAHVSVWVRKAGSHGNEQQDDNAQKKVHGDAADHHDDALPRGLLIHRIRLFFLGEEIILSSHSSDVAESTHGKRGQTILGVTAGKRRNLRAKTNVETAHAHAKSTGTKHVSRLV